MQLIFPIVPPDDPTLGSRHITHDRVPHYGLALWFQPIVPPNGCSLGSHHMLSSHGHIIWSHIRVLGFRVSSEGLGITFPVCRT